MREYIGIDIGGTKCAVVRGDKTGKIREKVRFATGEKDETLTRILDAAKQLCTADTAAAGISCGGPLDSGAGVILGPPNLPGWDHVEITKLVSDRLGVPAFLQNDADACALAEWKFGAGIGCRNLIFLTFGTGIGAGLILDGRLYSGTSGMAGEIGHVRLYESGHVGYGKSGSFEGYCSGGGIAQYGQGSAGELGGRAAAGEEAALKLWKQVGSDFGRLLAVLIDLLNPEMIVAGSIYARAGQYMEASMRETLEREALPQSLARCRIVPAGLSENLGDVAAVCVAINGCGFEKEERNGE